MDSYPEPLLTIVPPSQKGQPAAIEILIGPLEDHPDFESLVKEIPSYYDKNGKFNKNWEKDSVGYRNPFFVQAIKEVRALRVEVVRLDGVTETTGMWIDFHCPTNDRLPLVGKLSFRYQMWGKPPHSNCSPYRYCYVTVEWSNPKDS